ncbi:MAG TPA: hypothetical protein EYP10_03270 [Armatimonadetes bacterium]|nr:hypothetical protein [Armatimonadota bacterium]
MYASMWVFPWDLADEGIEEALLRIRDEAGIQCISVAASYDAGKLLLPHNPKRKVYFPEEGVIYFQPLPAWYAGLELQPQVSKICRERNLLREVTDVAQRLGMDVVAWTVCCHNSRLAAQNLNCAIVNCFGDYYITNLCPANEQVRAYVLAMIGDLLTNYPLHAIELESVEYMPFQHSYHHEKIEIELPPLIEFLLGLCFCRACEERARARGIDVVAVRSIVRNEVQRFFDAPGRYPRESVTWERVVNRLGREVEGYLLTRTSTITSFLSAICDSVKQRGQTRVHLFGDVHPGNLWQVGIDPNELAQLADSVIVLAYRSSISELNSALIVNRHILRGRANLIIGLHPSEKYSGSLDGFKERVRLCCARGADGISFFNYGLLARYHLSWIKQALSEATAVSS